MIDLPEGQLTAMQWFGLPPFWWGWILAGVFIAVGIAAAVAPRPGVLAERRGDHTSPRIANTWLIAVIVGAMVLHAYGFLGNFNLYDDFRQIHVEKHVNTLSWDNFWYLLLDNHKGSNQELMYLSFMFNWWLAKRAYWVWYLFNWLTLPVILLCVHWIAHHLTRDRVVGVLACAFVATSPIMSELLCWMSARSHLYGLLFTLFASGAYLEYLRRGERRGWWLLGLSVVAFYLSQMCKPIFLFLPVWLVLFDIFKARKRWYVGLVDKLPYVAIGIWSWYRISQLGAGKGLIKRTPLGGSYLNTLLQDFNLLVEYGRTTFIPSDLGMAPPYNEAAGWFFVEGVPMVLVNGFAPLASLLILLSVLAVAIAARVRSGDALPLFWLLAAGASVATVMNIPNRGHAATFEYRYTLSANVMTAILLGDLAVRFIRGRLGRRPSGRVFATGIVAAYLAWGAVVTASNTHAWQISHHLWVRNAEMYPLWYSSRYYAGKARQWNRQPYMAVQHLLAAEKINERNDKALHKRLGDNAFNIERYDLAREHWLIYFRRYPKKIDDKYLKKFEKVGLVVAANGRLYDLSEIRKKAEEQERQQLTPELRRRFPRLRPVARPDGTAEPEGTGEPEGTTETSGSGTP